ncbi:hypothetical protein FS837_004361 [Tulasnella sp. UAMH 9824]|nr:hypothetical protein FS837_004361 [Tulasnella sp. UAMH 9824]
MPERASDAEAILRNARAFPEYSIRRINRNLPTNDPANSPAALANSATGKLTELGEGQWYLKAFFHRRCEEKATAQSKTKQAEEKVYPQGSSNSGGKSSRRQLKGSERVLEHGPRQTISKIHLFPSKERKRTASIKLSTPLNIPLFGTAGPSLNLSVRRPVATEGTNPSIPSLPPVPPPTSSAGSLQVPDSSPTVRDLSDNEYQLAEYQILVALSNISFREALAVAQEGIPLLESMQGPETILTHLQSLELPRDMPIDPLIVREFERIVQLRRNVLDPTDPAIVAFDDRVRTAIFRARDRVLQEEWED